MWCNTPCMVASLVTRHSCDSRPCHFAHTRDNLCCLLRTMEWFECTMHIACFHLVVTPLVCVHQEWWVLEHEVRVVEQSICVSRRWRWLCIKPVIAAWNDAASSCEESLACSFFGVVSMTSLHLAVFFSALVAAFFDCPVSFSSFSD